MNLPEGYHPSTIGGYAQGPDGRLVPLGEVPGYNPSVGKDSGQDAISEMARDMNLNLSEETKDYLVQFYLNNKASEDAWKREMYSSSTQYQRAVEDIKKAGLNPYLAFDSLRGSNASSSAGSVSGNNFTQNKLSKREAGTNTAKAIMTVLGIVAAAIIGAML